MNTLTSLFINLVWLWNSVTISDVGAESNWQCLEIMFKFDKCAENITSILEGICDTCCMINLCKDLSMDWKDDCLKDLELCKVSDNGNTILSLLFIKVDTKSQISNTAVSGSFDENKRENTSLTTDLVAIYGLGAAVGLLALLLAATITGWVWTYCIMKRKEKILITARNNAIIDKIDNPNYTTGDQISLNQNPQPVPEYEIIPPHMGQEHGYDILNRVLPNSVPSDKNEQGNTTKFNSKDRNLLMCKPLQVEEEMSSSGDRVTLKREDHIEKDRKEEEHSQNDKGCPSSMNVATHHNERKKVTTKGGDHEERVGIIEIGEIESDGTGSEHIYFQLENGEKEQEQTMKDSVKKLSMPYYEEFK